MGEHSNTGRNRACAVQGDAQKVVADHQSVSRDLGAECLPAGVPAVRELRSLRSLSENRRHSRGKGSVMMMRVTFALCLSVAAFGFAPAKQTSPGAGPVIVLETAKGTIEFETYPEEAPKTVAQIVGLVKRNFYNGLRFHRAEASLGAVQIGDPQSRNMLYREYWGRAASGKPIGVAEITKKRKHRSEEHTSELQSLRQ